MSQKLSSNDAKWIADARAQFIAKIDGKEIKALKTELAAKDAQIAALREALEPFVRHGRACGAFGEDPGPYSISTDSGHRTLPKEDFHRARAALEMSGGGEVSAEWQPIETAPKDGTIILFPDRKWGVMPVKWNHSNSPGWVTHGGYPRESNLWHPLPEPPR